jgi:hypothetical protein
MGRKSADVWVLELLPLELWYSGRLVGGVPERLSEFTYNGKASGRIVAYGVVLSVNLDDHTCMAAVTDSRKKARDLVKRLRASSGETGPERPGPRAA